MARQKAGWPKVENAVRLTEEHGLGYCWLDTCCIDKSSSAELQEAINSMYRWYEDSFVCFAFLSDVQYDRRLEKDSPSLISSPLVIVADTTLPDSETLERNKAHAALERHFFRSRWFRRGWTLQELIAPHTLRFYDKDYFYLFLKGDASHAIMLSTGIDTDILENRAPVDSVSVAQRMSWASWRETSRVEDRAYSLLGISA